MQQISQMRSRLIPRFTAYHPKVSFLDTIITIKNLTTKKYYIYNHGEKQQSPHN